MKALVASLLIFWAQASSPQIRRPFKSDPPVMCDACPSLNAPIEPFKVFSNTYYVGTERLSSILIASAGGHILLDTGLPQSAELIDRNIRKLGFRIEDVKLIVVTHAVFDRAGGVHALQHASGARVAASRQDADSLRRSGDIARVASVRVVRDGETLRAGSLSVTAHVLPDLTAWLWKSCEGTTCRDFVYNGSPLARE